MAKIVRFIDENTSLRVAGMGVINNSNITIEKYERLIALSESHAKLFIVSDEEPAEKKPKTKSPTTNELQA